MKKKRLKMFKTIKFALIIFIALFPMLTIFGKTQLTSKNIEVERLKRQVIKQQKVNESLNMKVNELVSLENMQLVANNNGLAYINNNIIVIQK